MRLLFVDGTAGFEPDRLKSSPTGGILTSLTKIPQYLASKGHEVYVSCTIKKMKKIKGVTYLPINHKEKIPKWDVIIFNRNAVNNQAVAYSKNIGAKIVWWLHDIVDLRYLEDSSYKHLDRIIALSEYCKMSYSDFYDLPKELFRVIPNGVDKSVFFPGDYKKRKKYKMIMASAPIKGYLPIEATWGNVKRQFPSAELYIYSSQSLHGMDDSSVTTQFLESMEAQGAIVMQPVRQEILADIMRGAWILLMPNSYPEICSNLLLQARASGLPVVTSNIGANPEFIENKKTGVLTEHYPHDIWLWVKKYVEAVVTLCRDEKTHQMVSKCATEGIYDWDEIGEMWDKELEDLCSKI